MEIKTIQDLEKWMKDNCYSMESYSINNNFIYEGFGLENNGDLYQWFYIERGNKDILKYFRNEEEAVLYAFSEIKADAHAKRNFLGLFKERTEVEEIIIELKNRNVEFYEDKIPYGGIKDVRTRIFVIGCGIKKVKDLIKE